MNRITEHLRKSELKRCIDCIHNKQITHYKFIQNKPYKCNVMNVCNLYKSEYIHRKKTPYFYSLDARLDDSKCGIEGKYFVQKVTDDIVCYLNKSKPWYER